MKLDKHIVDMFTELTKPADDVKMEKTCYGTISVVDGTRYVKLDGGDLLVPAASTVKTSHGDRVTVLMKNHSLTITGNLTAPATDGEGGSSGEAGTAATIKVGTVTTGEAGSSAAVTNSGTTSAAVFDFVIPKGDKGDKGDTGPQGPQGEKGDTGTWDGTIPDHEHAVSNITDFPTSLPANGGNADTVDGLHANEIASKPNLLDNPDFKINQRGLTMYTGGGYTVDRWSGSSYLSVDVNDNGIILSANGGSGYFTQTLIENISDLYGKMLTGTITLENHGPISIGGICPSKDESAVFAETALPGISSVFRIYKSTISETGEIFIGFRVVIRDGETVAITSSKLELGSVATPFCPPDPATELLKVQSMNDIGTLKLISNSTLPTIMNSQMVSNPNLLDNADFKINQRGQTVYNGPGYSVDRWRVSSSLTMNVSDSITISAGDATGYFEQYLDRGNDFDNKPLTLSAHLLDGTVLSASGVCPQAPESGRPLFITIKLPGGNEVRMYRGSTVDSFSLLCQLRVYSGKSTSNLRALKLELGGVATLFCPPDPATELAKCQRYYQKYFPQDMPRGHKNTDGHYSIIRPIPDMRIVPTVTHHWTFGEIFALNAGIIDSNNAACTAEYSTSWYTTEKMLHIDVTSSATTNNVYLPRVDDGSSYCELSAEL